MLSQEDATSHVLTHVERAKESLKNIREGQVSADGVFIHPKMQTVQLKVAREELDKLVWERLEANPHLTEKK